jgi:fibronectin-binding autotransporter adhesin
MNDVTVGSSGTVTTSSPGNSGVTLGALGGSGAIDVGSNVLALLPFHDQTFSGSVTWGQNMSVAGTGTQTFTGTLNWGNAQPQLRGTAGVTLAGTAAAPTGGGVFLTGRASYTLDNSTTNLTDRFGNGGNLAMNGGMFTFIGNAAGSGETLGQLFFSTGQSVVRIVDNTGGTAPTALTFSTFDTFIAQEGSINFASNRPLAGSGTNNPQVLFGSAPGTSNGVISGSGVLGFAVVNGTDFANYSNGVVAATSTPVSATLTSAPSQNSNLTGSATIGAGATVSYNTLKISPSGAGQSLAIGNNGVLDTTAILLDGTNGQDFAITGGVIAGSSTRHFHVWDPNRTLSVSSNLATVSQGIVKSGDGVLALTGTSDQLAYLTFNSNTDNQVITLTGGVLRANITGGPGVNFGTTNNALKISGGVLEIANGATFSRTTSVSPPANGTVDFDAEGGFSAFGSAAAVSLNGGAQLSAGTSGFVMTNGNALLLNSQTATALIDFRNPIALGNGNIVQPQEFRVADNPNSTTDVARLSGAISGTIFTDFVKSGPGVLELTAANTYAGNTRVVGGTLRLNDAGAGGNDRLPTATNLIVSAGATFDTSGFSQAVGSLSGGGTAKVTTGTLTVNGGNSTTFSGTITGTGGFTKAGSSTLILSGTSDHTGPTAVNGGTLVVNGALGSTAVTVAGATLGGTGTIAGSLTVNSGGTVAPGNSVGTLNTGAAAFANGGKLAVELGSANASPGANVSDVLNVTGTLTLNSGSQLFVDVAQVPGGTSAFAPNTTYNYTIATTTGGVVGNLSQVAITSNVTGPAMFALTTAGNTLRLGLTFAPVPEPAHALLLAGAGAAAAGGYRRRRTRSQKESPPAAAGGLKAFDDLSTQHSALSTGSGVRRRPRSRAPRTSCTVNPSQVRPADSRPPARPAVGLKSGFGFTSRMNGLTGERTRKSTRA